MEKYIIYITAVIGMSAIPAGLMLYAITENQLILPICLGVWGFALVGILSRAMWNYLN